MLGHFTKPERKNKKTKNQKKKSFLFFLENVAVKFKWWVYKFVLVTVTVKS